MVKNGPWCIIWFEKYNIALICALPVWRNGSASVSDAEGFGFKSRYGYIFVLLFIQLSSRIIGRAHQSCNKAESVAIAAASSKQQLNTSEHIIYIFQPLSLTVGYILICSTYSLSVNAWCNLIWVYPRPCFCPGWDRWWFF